jgi:hypothetical protein
MRRTSSVLQAGLLLATLLWIFPASAESDELPDAPNETPVHAATPKHIAKWYGVVDPGEKVPPLYTRDKLEFWLHEQVNPISLLPAFVSAGYGQVTGTDPKYGSDSAAFGERLGAAALRQASMRFFSDSFLPAVTHEDPRYFRKAYGSIVHRGLYAAERVVVDQRDDGSRGFNYSDTLGRGMASALTMTYYPEPSVRPGVVFRTWGVSLAGAAGNNLFLEFWPDIRDKLFHRWIKEQ